MRAPARSGWRRAIELDYEGKRTYRFTVQVTDGRDQNGDDDMDATDDTINGDRHRDERQRGACRHRRSTLRRSRRTPTRAIATYTGIDPERDTLTWSVSAETTSGSPAEASSTSARRPASSSRTTYPVTVTATDDDVDNTPVKLTVRDRLPSTNVEEAGCCRPSPRLAVGWTSRRSSTPA